MLVVVLPTLALIILLATAVCGWLIFAREESDSPAAVADRSASDNEAEGARRREQRLLRHEVY
jgi:hypothetical protein